jgi:hypothetical protein
MLKCKVCKFGASPSIRCRGEGNGGGDEKTVQRHGLLQGPGRSSKKEPVVY